MSTLAVLLACGAEGVVGGSAWAHRAVVLFHSGLHLKASLLYRKHAPLARYLPDPGDRDAYVGACAALAAAKGAVFVLFWVAHCLFAPDPDDDHVAVAPSSLHDASLELRAMLPARRRNLV